MCWHSINLDKNRHWFYGYLHQDGTIKTKRLPLVIPDDKECDFCFTVSERSPFVVEVFKPIAARNTSDASMTFFLRHELTKNTKVPKSKSRFELLDLE